MTYKIAMLMGGDSFERDFSLASGKFLLRTLEQEGHTVVPIDTSTSLVETLRAEKPDVAYIALHGGHGEDGTIQALLEYLAIPFVGSTSSVCRTTWNKSMLPHVLTSHRSGAEGFSSWPRSVCLSTVSFKSFGAAEALDLITERIPTAFPLAVLPASGGSAMGISKVERFDDLASAILDALSFDDEVLLEEWVNGVELAVGVVGCGDNARALPPVEICPHTGFFNTEVRLSTDLVDYYAPVRSGSLSPDAVEAARIRALIEDAALEVHRSFGCRDLSRVDLFWDGEKVKILEVNVSPGMSEHSLFPMASKAADIPLGSLLNELFAAAVNR
jgi:D-alanine-D-alanine ligase